MSPHAFTEDQLVEQPAVALFGELGWTTVSASDEVFGPKGTQEWDKPAPAEAPKVKRCACGKPAVGTFAFLQVCQSCFDEAAKPVLERYAFGKWKTMSRPTKFTVPVGKCGCRFAVRYGIRRIDHTAECAKKEKQS